MARTRVTARKSVLPVTRRETFQLEYHRPHNRAHAALRLKELAIENQDRTIQRLRASNRERREQVENLTTKLTTAERRIDEVCHMLELTKDHNLGLRESLGIAVEQAREAKEEKNQRIRELIELKQSRLEETRKITESWIAIMRLTESNQRLSEEVDKEKEDKKKLLEKHAACHEKAGSLLGEAVAGIQTRDEEISNLKFEKLNLQWQIEDMLNPGEPEEDPEEEDPEEEEALPDAAVGDGEIE